MIEYSLNQFWNENILNIKEEQFILIQFKVKIATGIIRSISHVQTVQKKDYKILLESFLIFWDIRSEVYKLTEVESVIYSFQLIEKNNIEINKSKITKLYFDSLESKEKQKFEFKGYNLPCTMDITQWGNLIYLNDECSKALIYRAHSKAEYHVTLYFNYLISEIKYKDKTIIKFKDEMLDKTELKSFKRLIGKQEYIYLKKVNYF